MTHDRVTLKLTLAKAGISSVTLATFSERLNIQKRVYLTQSQGSIWAIDLAGTFVGHTAVN